MIALACLLGIAAIVWLLVKDAEDRDYEAEAYTDTREYPEGLEPVQIDGKTVYVPTYKGPIWNEHVVDDFSDWDSWDWPNYDDYRGSAA